MILDDLDHPKQCKYSVNCLLVQCNCMKEEGKQTRIIQAPMDLACTGKNFMHSLFAAEKEEWKRKKKN